MTASASVSVTNMEDAAFLRVARVRGPARSAHPCCAGPLWLAGEGRVGFAVRDAIAPRRRRRH